MSSPRNPLTRSVCSGLYLSLASALMLAVSNGRALAQGLTPVGPEDSVHPPSGANQNDGGIDWSADGTRIATSWASGQNIFARIFDGDQNPVTGALLVNDTIVNGNQDQPQVCVGTTNNTLVAWSDREANDGDLIGIFARVYDPSGVPITAEFQVNDEWLASQFRPAIARTNSGGFVVAWTGQFDGDCFFRVLDQNGNLITGDIFANGFDLGSQTHPEVAVLPDDRIFVAYEDSSAMGGLGGGRNIWGRFFGPGGGAQGPDFPLAETIVGGAQRNPRIAVDPLLQNFFVVWEDDTNDGDGWGIFGRLFDRFGVPFGTEFQINTDSLADQRRPDIAVDATGLYVICWDSFAAGGSEIRAQRINALGELFGSEETISEVPQGGYLRPEVSIRASDQLAQFIYDGPGAGDDTFTRRFQLECVSNATNYCVAAPNSQGPGALISMNGSTSLAANDLQLVATGAIPGNFGLFFYGKNQIMQNVANGVKCVGGGGLGLFRTGTVLTSPGGIAMRSIDYFSQSNPAGLITAGSTWNFQYFYRDSVGAFANYSDALELTFCP